MFFDLKNKSLRLWRSYPVSPIADKLLQQSCSDSGSKWPPSLLPGALISCAAFNCGSICQPILDSNQPSTAHPYSLKSHNIYTIKWHSVRRWNPATPLEPITQWEHLFQVNLLPLRLGLQNQNQFSGLAALRVHLRDGHRLCRSKLRHLGGLPILRWS